MPVVATPVRSGATPMDVEPHIQNPSPAFTSTRAGDSGELKSRFAEEKKPDSSIGLPSSQKTSVNFTSSPVQVGIDEGFANKVSDFDPIGKTAETPTIRIFMSEKGNEDFKPLDVTPDIVCSPSLRLFWR